MFRCKHWVQRCTEPSSSSLLVLRLEHCLSYSSDSFVIVFVQCNASQVGTGKWRLNSRESRESLGQVICRMQVLLRSQFEDEEGEEKGK
jgi:hypothetical protein